MILCDLYCVGIYIVSHLTGDVTFIAGFLLVKISTASTYHAGWNLNSLFT